MMDFYTVGVSDTLEGIAARSDCTPSELIKFNHLHSRLIFPGQKLRIPPPPSAVKTSLPAVHRNAKNGATECSTNQELFGSGSRLISGLKKEENVLIKRTPDSEFLPKKPIELSLSNGLRPEPDNIPPAPGSAVRTSPTDAELDNECFRKFLKLRVKHFTDEEGTVSGTLLVTPNCLMFDPDVTHPLVRENGPDPYGLVAPLEQIMSAALYQNVSAMTGEQQNPEEYIPSGKGDKEQQERSKSEADKSDITDTGEDNKENRHSLPVSLKVEEHVQFDIGAAEGEQGRSKTSEDTAERTEENDGKKEQNSPRLPCINEEELAHVGEGPGEQTVQRRHMSESESTYRAKKRSNNLFPLLTDSQEEEQVCRSCPSLHDENTKCCGSQEKLGPTKSMPPGSGFASLRLRGIRRSLKHRASSISDTISTGRDRVQSGAQAAKGAVTSGAQAVSGAVTSGAQAVTTAAVTGAEKVSTGAQNVAGVVASGTRTAAGAVTSGAKAAADAVVKAPQNFVNMGTGLFDPGEESNLGVMDIQDSWFSEETPSRLRRQQSLATLELLKAKSAQYRVEAASKFSCATAVSEKPELFKSIDELLPAPPPTTESPELPYYFCVRLVRKRRKKRRRVGSESMYSALAEEPLFGNKKKVEFWFTIPREKADVLYGFLLQWKVGSRVHEEQVDEAGFLILDNEEDLQVENPSTPLFGSYLNREWEIVTVEEVRRRLDLDLSPQDLPLPEGSASSKILDEAQIRQILDVLPARAESYPWVLVYGSDEHGFSLRTLYRKMVEWEEDISPTLLIIKDTKGWIFGAMVSGPIRKSDHFYGTGDSCFLFSFHPESELRTYPWSGENQFFVKASQDSLAIGAGRGTFGLWLDQDLNHGRTRKCPTFENPPLTQDEDFIIKQVEAWGFSMGF